MSGWEIEDMVADENARIWEMMHPPVDEEPEPEPDYNLYQAEFELDRGIDRLHEAVNRVQDAADEAEGHSVSAKIQAAHDALEKTEKWIKELKESITQELLETERRRHVG